MSRQAVHGIIEALDALSIPYMVVGSLSSSAYGVARATQDADLVIELGTTPVSAIASRLGPEFVLNPQMSFETITGTSRIDLRHVATRFKIELFLLTDDPHDRERFRRRRDRAAAALDRLPGFRCPAPPASFYLFPSIPGDDRETAAQWLADLSIAVLPGSAFGELGRGHLRLSLTASDEILDEALRRIERMYRG